MLRTHTCGELTRKDIGKEVQLCGWIATIRILGKYLAFIDLRDRYGITQINFNLLGLFDTNEENALKIQSGQEAI